MTRALVVEEGMCWEENDMERGEGEAGENEPEEIERIREGEPSGRWRRAGVEKAGRRLEPEFVYPLD